MLWDVGVVVKAHWRGGEGARMTFLQGGPKFEVTPLKMQSSPEKLQVSPAQYFALKFNRYKLEIFEMWIWRRMKKIG